MWNQIAGPPVTLSAADAAKPSFMAPTKLPVNSSTLLFQLKVSDDENATGLSTVKITVKPAGRAPIANAGTNQTVNAGNICLCNTQL